MTNIYALYKGDEFITEGTVREIAKELNVKYNTIQHYHTPAYEKRSAKINKNRLKLILIEKNIKEKFRSKK